MQQAYLQTMHVAQAAALQLLWNGDRHAPRARFDDPFGRHMLKIACLHQQIGDGRSAVGMHQRTWAERQG